MNIKHLDHKTILITGAAGFIGFYLAKALLHIEASDICIIGLDNLSDYYDVSLKEERLRILKESDTSGQFSFLKTDLADKGAVDDIFSKYHPDIVINLAAQAGVRYSITHPEAYIFSNIIGFFNLLEACRHSYDNGASGVEHLIYASSSSVYGSNEKVPYSTEDPVDHPVSLYAATKKSDELLAHAYSKLYHIPATGLRFFTVYGPLGRPDMAYFGFTNRLIKGESIQIFNHGDMYRDFTYIDDIIEGILRIMEKSPSENTHGVPYKLYNIGNSKPEKLLDFVETLENCLIQEGILKEPGKKEFLPMQLGDVYQTFADVSELEKDFGFKPSTSLKNGLGKFAHWYKEFYHIQTH